MKRLGIDIGSKTVKLALVDEDGTLIASAYERHRSKVQEKLLSCVHDFVWRLGDDEVWVTVTGSAGLRVAELFGIPFVQEVVALKRAVQHFLPGTDVVLEMGGEDTKLIYLTGVPEQRMNTICAGGTGGFIDMMAGLMGKRNEDMQRLAMGARQIYPIASRCAVFAQSDVRPLLNAGARKEDVAASVLEAVCTQAVAGLSCGRPIEGKVALLGGPFEYTPALRGAFCKVTGIKKNDAVIPKDAHLFVVQGAAMSAEASEPMLMSELEAAIRNAVFSSEEGINRLPKLFESEEEYEEFLYRHDSCRIPVNNLVESNPDLFLGIDAGSTTMKMALIDDQGALLAFEYDWNEGDVTVSLVRLLTKILKQVNGRWMTPKTIRCSCIIGYGEDFCKAAYGVDFGEVETVAHLRAATALDPQVDFLIDIGGQDIKCFYVKDGVINDIVLNEACSSGCGSLFDSVARSMRMTKEGLAKTALFAESPVDLGTRCSVFMDSRVKHAQKEGVSQADIAAGVVYSTARNALHKVVRQPDFSKVGEHIMVQGGAFANDALLRAFELETKTECKRPDKSQIMGAWGAALLARDKWMSLKERDPQAAEETVSTLISLEELENLRVSRTAVRCDQCTNVCKLMITKFYNGREREAQRTYVTGNRCEKGAAAYGAKQAVQHRPPNMTAVKNALLKSYDVKPQPDGPVIGIPRALSLYESYPFWKTFFNQLGCQVLESSESNETLFRKGMGSIPAEGACYPSKLFFGHAADLASRGAEMLFVPAMKLAFSREGLLGEAVSDACRDCPLIERMPQLLADNAASSLYEGTPIIALNLLSSASLEDAAPELLRALNDAGVQVSADEVAAALTAAQEEYRNFFGKLAVQQEKILARIADGEFPGALVNGHPYHADPGIGHGIDRLLGDLGYAVIEQADYDFANRAIREGYEWLPNGDLLHAVQASADNPNLQFIMLRSFGCGIDALAMDKAHDELRAQGRIFAELKLDQIVDLAAVRIRLRSLAYATQQRRGEVFLQPVPLPDPEEFMTVASGASAPLTTSANRYSARRRQGRVELGWMSVKVPDARKAAAPAGVYANPEGLKGVKSMPAAAGCDVGVLRGLPVLIPQRRSDVLAPGERAPKPAPKNPTTNARTVSESVPEGHYVMAGFGGVPIIVPKGTYQATPPGVSNAEAGPDAGHSERVRKDGAKTLREEYRPLVDAMAERGWEFVADRTYSESNMVSHFMLYVIFAKDDETKFFTGWDDVQAFLEK